MAIQHYNRLIAHWGHTIKLEGSGLTFGSKQRHRSLTPGAGSVAQFVAQHLNSETNSYPISQKTLVNKLPLAKSTIGLALDELVAWGIFTRERAHYEPPYRLSRKCSSDCEQVHYELPYNYKLAVPCPSDCEHLVIHNTKSELATLPENQATPTPIKQTTSSPKNQATGLLNNRQLIESNKEINKEMNKQRTPCFTCPGDYEVLTNGIREIIHTHSCEQLTKLENSQAWNITQTEIGSAWGSLDNRERQVANYLSLAKGKERTANRNEKVKVASQDQAVKFHKVITRTLAEHSLDKYNPLILEWLEIVYKQRQELSDSHISRAVKYTKSGWHLKPEGDWRLGVMINSDHFIEGESSND